MKSFMRLLNKITITLLNFIAIKILKDPFYQSFKKLQDTVKDLGQFEKDILNNVFHFTNKVVADIMIPRSDIIAAHIDVNEEELYNTIESKGHTRTLIYGDTLDDIIGFVHIKDLYFTLMKENKLNLRNIIRKPMLVVKSMKLIDLLKYMQQQRIHIACVVDEYGGIDGITTLEDIISELIGPMNDEHEIIHESLANYELIDNNNFLINARMEIEELEKLINQKLKQKEDYCDTVGGLVLCRAGYMPKIGEVINLTNMVLAEVIACDSKTIKKIKITII